MYNLYTNTGIMVFILILLTAIFIILLIAKNRLEDLIHNLLYNYEFTALISKIYDKLVPIKDSIKIVLDVLIFIAAFCILGIIALYVY